MRRLLVACAAALLLLPAVRAADKEKDKGGELKVEKLDKAAVEIPDTLEWWGTPKRPSLAALKGKVVLLHFWTYGEAESEANFFHYGQWKKAFESEGLRIIGIHVPGMRQIVTDKEFEGWPKHAQERFQAELLEDDKAARVTARTLEQVFPNVFAKDATYFKACGGKNLMVEANPTIPNGPKTFNPPPHVPTFFLVDRAGKFRLKAEGPLGSKRADNSKEVESTIEALLKEKKQ